MAWIMEFDFMIHLLGKLFLRIYHEPGSACPSSGAPRVAKTHLTGKEFIP